MGEFEKHSKLVNECEKQEKADKKELERSQMQQRNKPVEFSAELLKNLEVHDSISALSRGDENAEEREKFPKSNASQLEEEIRMSQHRLKNQGEIAANMLERMKSDLYHQRMYPQSQRKHVDRSSGGGFGVEGTEFLINLDYMMSYQMALLHKAKEMDTDMLNNFVRNSQGLLYGLRELQSYTAKLETRLTRQVQYIRSATEDRAKLETEIRCLNYAATKEKASMGHTVAKLQDAVHAKNEEIHRLRAIITALKEKCAQSEQKRRDLLLEKTIFQGGLDRELLMHKMSDQDEELYAAQESLKELSFKNRALSRKNRALEDKIKELQQAK